MVMWGIGLRGRKEDWIKEIGFVARAQIGRGFFAYNTETRGGLKTTVTRLLFWVANRNEGDVANSVTRICALNVLKNAWRLGREDDACPSSLRTTLNLALRGFIYTVLNIIK
jgi:hypothetical protein